MAAIVILPNITVVINKRVRRWRAGRRGKKPVTVLVFGFINQNQ
ncbi:hypothetical protein L905_11935 [Agrobacterium sp. TS43]|nr:hypothetical protein L904_22895 [Agrobacterium sp. LY4]KVK46828.1 hypothetical protein L903_22815 [Agrobacterium sp. JL28]KVK61149.1 hypothetical protein L906_21925 [Agrobacterium sp. TS45]KVK66279.1 hypothetical protein L907_21885 [Agrobacterium sp. C13]KVK70248.1 hypothetical protein L905_11935 [Agrobacterium sp. TS43]